MSAQILLQGKVLGGEEFLLAVPADKDNRAFDARCIWLAMLGEVIPRVLLEELQLPSLMLGSSGGDRFVVILPDRERSQAASEFLSRVSASLEKITMGRVRLAWSATENLGDWTIVRKRLHEGLGTGLQPLVAEPGFFEPFTAPGAGPDLIPRDLREAAEIGWSFDFPALLAAAPAEGATWRFEVGSEKAIPLVRHSARSGDVAASTKDISRRSRGLKLWGVLRGEIDDLGTRMRRLQSVEEHVHLSTLYKHFLAGEIELLCSHSDYFQRVTVLQSAGGSFALFGAWDALAGFARELERLFARFAQEQLKELPGAEAKTVTMALTAAETGASLARTYEDCGRDLEVARAADKDCFHLLGRVLEWKQFNDAAELKEAVIRLNEEFRGGRPFLAQLRNLYRKVEAPQLPGTTPDSTKQDNDRLAARALRFQRRFANVGNRREREFQKLRSHLMKEMAGRNLRGRLKLRPEGLIALEWARLAED